MRKLLFILLMVPILSFSQETTKKDWNKEVKKIFKFSTFYGAVNGGTSLSDVDVYSVSNGLETEIVGTPFDYSIVFGVKKNCKNGI